MAASLMTAGPCFLATREHTQDPPDARVPFMTMDVIADGADRWPDAHGVAATAERVVISSR